MQVIRESAEHHFLTSLESLKQDLKGWVFVHFALSKKVSHTKLVENPKDILKKIEDVHANGRAFFEDVKAQATALDTGFLYQFIDNDIVLLVQAQSDDEKNKVQDIYKQFSKKLDAEFFDTGLLKNEIYNMQKLADQKILAANRFEAYRSLADEHKVSSIGVRRSRRSDPVVMLVEDDRFTASYTSNILNKDYELIICKNGEEGIKRYVEAAPDVVLLDIHLPGLSGHQTLQAIKAADPNAFVVMLSVDTIRESIVKASEIGAKSFLKKPFSKERLINTVKSSPFISGASSSAESLH